MPSPAIFFRIPKFARTRVPTAEADAPNAIKTREKPKTKGRLFTIALVTSRERCCWSVNSSKLIPVMKVRYPGTIGRTQGEINDKKPASTAIPSPMSIIC
jgi:hypothetical protein